MLSSAAVAHLKSASPTGRLSGNDLKRTAKASGVLFHGSYERYLLNELRERLPYAEVPIKLLFRARERKSLEEVQRKGRRAAQETGEAVTTPRTAQGSSKPKKSARAKSPRHAQTHSGGRGRSGSRSRTRGRSR